MERTNSIHRFSNFPDALFEIGPCFQSFFFGMEKTMQKLGNFVVEFMKREDGPTAVEYAVMLALIIVVCIGAITTLGKNANGTFTSVGTAISSSSSS